MTALVRQRTESCFHYDYALGNRVRQFVLILGEEPSPNLMTTATGDPLITPEILESSIGQGD
jgi:hypothetical protein